MFAVVHISHIPAGAVGSGLRVSYIDVGQGDSILLSDALGMDVLIDGGRASAGPTVVAYIQSEGVDDIDYLIASHADADHIGGLIDVLQATDIPVDAVLYNGYPGDTATWNDFVTAVANEGLVPTPVSFPSTFNWGEITVHVLNPESGLTSPAQNDVSVVLLVSHGANDFLFTGDIDSTMEATIVARGTPVSSEVLKVAHHGSSYSSSSEFLSAVDPSEAVISVGSNPYGHPAPDVLTRLEDAGARIFRTDEDGTIVIESDGITYAIVSPVQVETAPPQVPVALGRAPNNIELGDSSKQWFTRVALGPGGTAGTAFQFAIWLHIPNDWQLEWGRQYSFTGDFANASMTRDFSTLPWVSSSSNCYAGGPAASGYKWRAWLGPEEQLPPDSARLSNTTNLRGNLKVPVSEALGTYGEFRTVVGIYLDTDSDGTPDTLFCNSGLGSPIEVVEAPPEVTPTPTPTSTSTPSPSPTAVPIVNITGIHYDGAEPYYEGDEYAVITNQGTDYVNLNGWRLNAGDPGQDFYFPSYSIAPGQSCRVYTDENHPEYCGFNFGSGVALWSNAGDCGYLYNDLGQQVSSHCY